LFYYEEVFHARGGKWNNLGRGKEYACALERVEGEVRGHIMGLLLKEMVGVEIKIEKNKLTLDIQSL